MLKFWDVFEWDNCSEDARNREPATCWEQLNYVPCSFFDYLYFRTYYIINSFIPVISCCVFRFLRQFLILFLLHLASLSMFRFVASIFQTAVASMTAGSIAIMGCLLFGGFVIPKRTISHNLVNRIFRWLFWTTYPIAASMPAWLQWGFWISPMTYGEIGLTTNEFLAPRWEKVLTSLAFSM